MTGTADRSQPQILRTLSQAASRAPMLSKERELELAKRWLEQKDRKALEQLLASHFRLVLATATKYRNYGLPIADLAQEGMVGLMEAASRFDPSMEARFATYAAWWVRSAMQDYILRNWSIVRTGTTAAHKRLFFNLRRMRAAQRDLLKDNLDGPMSHSSRQKVADQLHVRVKDVETMEARMSGNDMSLNSPYGESGDFQWQDLLVCDRSQPEQTVIDDYNSDLRIREIQDALALLTDREQLVIRRRRLAARKQTLSDLGVELGVSKERVRQIENEAMLKMRKSMTRALGDAREAGLIPS